MWGIQASVKRKGKGFYLCYLSAKAEFGKEKVSVLKIGRWQEEETRRIRYLFGHSRKTRTCCRNNLLGAYSSLYLANRLTSLI
jgi:hypothetical protein